MLLNSFMYFLAFFVVAVFHHKICVFIIFNSFSDKVSNFRNRILTNRKRELVVCNCRWNCMILLFRGFNNSSDAGLSIAVIVTKDENKQNG